MKIDIPRPDRLPDAAATVAIAGEWNIALERPLASRSKTTTTVLGAMPNEQVTSAVVIGVTTRKRRTLVRSA